MAAKRQLWGELGHCSEIYGVRAIIYGIWCIWTTGYGLQAFGFKRAATWRYYI